MHNSLKMAFFVLSSALVVFLSGCGVRVVESKNSCFGNLKTIAGAKETWASDTHASNGTVVNERDLLPLLRKFPVCPHGGKYTISTIGEPSTCSHPEHQSYAIGGQGSTSSQPAASTR
jgi:hypothetical protein